MNIYRRYHNLSHAGVLLGILTFCVADPHPGLALIATVLLIGSWILFRETVVSPLPRWAINVLLLGATLIMFRATFANPLALQSDAITILSEYLTSLQLIKLFESRTPRDQAQLLVLNAMLVIGAVLTSVTLQVGVMLMLYAPTFLATVLLYQLFAGQCRVISSRNRPLPEILSATPIASGDRVPRDLRRITGVAVVLIGLVASVVFLVMPRNIGDDMVGRWPRAAAGASAGFSDTVQLGGEGLISESRDVVLEVEIYIDGVKSTLVQNQYLRGAVLDEYDPTRAVWSRSGRLQDLDKKSTSQLRIAAEQRGLAGLPPPIDSSVSKVQVFTVRNRTTDHLFALWRPVQVACDVSAPIYLNPEDKTLHMYSGAGMLSYTVRSIITPEPQRGASNDDAADEAPDATTDPEPPRRAGRRRRNITTFVGTPIEAYARDLMAKANIERTDDARADLRILQLFERHLRDNFTYTLDLVAPEPGVEPLEAFLTQTKSGNCEYFASAMVAMAQSIGIPARIVTGYATNEIDPVTGAYIARKSNAHAWVEALVRIVTDDPTDAMSEPHWIPTWYTFDPTPPSELHALNKPRTGIIGLAQRLLDRAEQLWIRGIVAFNADRQQEILHETGVSTLSFDRLSRFFRHIPHGAVNKALQFLATALGAFFVLMAILFGARATLRRALASGVRRVHLWWLERTDPVAARSARQSDLYERMLRLLARAGIPKPAGVPPIAFAERLRPFNPTLAERVESLARLYYGVRFGRTPLSPAAIDDAELQLRALKQELRSANRDAAP